MERNVTDFRSIHSGPGVVAHKASGNGRSECHNICFMGVLLEIHVVRGDAVTFSLNVMDDVTEFGISL
jgi:hypothetical protein